MDLNVRDSKSRTPQMMAAYFGRAAMLRLLLKHGADLEAGGLDRQLPHVQYFPIRRSSKRW